MINKIPFTVSARTARLIGKQNFANADGAVIELIKNGYDADATKCVVIFDNKYASLPDNLTKKEYECLNKEKDLSWLYVFDKRRDQYALQDASVKSYNQIKQEQLKDVRNFFRSKCKLYILDNGDGMDVSIIKNKWMVIGTENKQNNPYTRNGRVKSGAKGIGRFALDRLGALAEVVTKPDPDSFELENKCAVYFWKIKWNDFEGDSKTIGQVNAELKEDFKCDFRKELRRRLPLTDEKFVELGLDDFCSGTLIEIALLSDEWNQNRTEHIYSSLQVLIPPKLIDEFDIYLYSTHQINEYGKISPEQCEDYDYKLEALADNKGNVKIKIFFNEYEKTLLKEDAFFQRPNMQKEEYNKKIFERGFVSYDLTLEKLLPGYSSIDVNDILQQVGAFDFTFYFLKMDMPGKPENEYFYNKIHPAQRKQWLKLFSGIKIFRDNFKIRPYGDKGGGSFDWLDLGTRVSKSPAGVAKKGGGWRVGSKNVCGIANISRLTNLQFDDKAGREGIQENTVFSVFKELLIRLISDFERYRAYVARELKAYYTEIIKESDIVPDEEYDETVKKVDEDLTKMEDSVEKAVIQKDVQILKKYTQQQTETIEELRDEQKLLRALASGALTTASFAHELNSIEENLVYRIDETTKLFKKIVDESKFLMIEEAYDPFLYMQDVKNEDKKLKEWLKHSLEVIRWDKRRRTSIDIKQYFDHFKKSWQMSFDERGIKFEFKGPSEVKFRIFEVDLDCIFNNLLTNSIEAFRRKDAPYERKINIELIVDDSDVCIKYFDSGPGLSKDIIKPNDIFEPHFTTKRNVNTGEASGTGLGMWLVKSIVADNNGVVELLFLDKGFGASIKFADKLRGNHEEI
ncbi:MAG: sensor histidine kinase [Candidatus Aureabacteria bacterium]|nr:sensor histidine kinase [Candidatus Auribacterota bacterium]